MDHDQFFKKLMHLFLQAFFEVFFPAWSNRFRFDQVEWLEQEVFPEPPRGEKLVVDVLAKLPVIPADPPREHEPRESVALILIETESSTRLADFRQRMYDYTSCSLHLNCNEGGSTSRVFVPPTGGTPVPPTIRSGAMNH